MPTLIRKRKNWLLLGFLNLFSSLCLVSLALISKFILDAAQEKDTKTVLWQSFLLLGMILLGIVFKFVENCLYARFSIQREMELKYLLLEKRLKLSSFESNYHSAVLMQNYTVDISNILTGEMEVYPAIFYQIGRFLFALTIVAILDYRILLVLLLFGVIGLLLSFFYFKKMEHLHKEVLESDGQMNSFFQETVENISIVQSYHAQDNFLNFYKGKQEQCIKTRKKKYHLRVLTMNVMVLASNIVYGACIGYGGYAIAVGWITYGSLLALTQLIQHLQGPLLSVSSFINQHSLTKTSFQRLENMLKGVEHQQLIIDDFERITLSNVAIGYHNEPIIKGISFSILPGDIIKINGDSGIGKTTLFMTLLGNLQPLDGEIICQTSKDIVRNVSLSSLCAYVSQDNILFSGSIRDNFLLLTNATEKKMLEALAFASLDEEITSLDLVLNERGRGLSVGQLQRLMLAIAYAKDRPIFLLDEFTSALDSWNAQKIVNNIISLNKTVIYISHKGEEIPFTKCVDL